MSERWCRICDGWHSIEDAWPIECMRHYNPKRSNLPAPHVISDTMEHGVESQLDGKIYTSKSELRRTYREGGVVEIGNEKQKKTAKHRNDKKGVLTTLEKAKARVERGERSTAFKRKHPFK